MTTRTRSTIAAAFVLAMTSLGPVLAAQTPAIGTEAPSFELAAWTGLEKGEADPSAESLAGKVVMIEFWGTWCQPCVKAMPQVQALHDRYRARGLKVLAIS